MDEESPLSALDEKQKRKREQLLARLGVSEVATITERVAWVLDRYREARNSDTDLHIRYWQEFDNVGSNARG